MKIFPAFALSGIQLSCTKAAALCGRKKKLTLAGLVG
jgi:hypothetical protein